MANAKICKIFQQYRPRISRYNHHWLDVTESDKMKLRRFNGSYNLNFLNDNEDYENLLIFYGEECGPLFEYFAITDERILTKEVMVELRRVTSVKEICTDEGPIIAVDYEDNPEGVPLSVACDDIFLSRYDAEEYIKMLNEMVNEARRHQRKFEKRMDARNRSKKRNEFDEFEKMMKEESLQSAHSSDCDNGNEVDDEIRVFVIITGFDRKRKLNAQKRMKALTGVSLTKAEKILDNIPVVFAEGLIEEKAYELKQALAEEGITSEISQTREVEAKEGIEKMISAIRKINNQFSEFKILVKKTSERIKNYSESIKNTSKRIKKFLPLL